MSAIRSKKTYLSARYRRIAARRGPIKAIVATEHTILVAAWNMLTTGQSWNDLGADYYARRNPERAKDNALRKLRELGYEVALTPAAA